MCLPQAKLRRFHGMDILSIDYKSKYLSAINIYFQFYIHNPSAFPQVGTRGMAAGVKTENFVRVSAALTET